MSARILRNGRLIDGTGRTWAHADIRVENDGIGAVSQERLEDENVESVDLAGRTDEMRKFADRFNVIDNSLQPVRAHQNGARGYINWTVDIYPPYELKVWELLESRCYAEAQSMLDRLYTPLQRLAVKVGSRSGGYSMHKALMALVGHPVGPPRPPTLPLSPAHMAELREILIGLDWPVVEAVG